MPFPYNATVCAQVSVQSQCESSTKHTPVETAFDISFLTSFVIDVIKIDLFYRFF